MDVWQEWNIEPQLHYHINHLEPMVPLRFKSKIWAELFANLTWYDTRFIWYYPKYRSLAFDATVWLGVRVVNLWRDCYLMPYIRPEISLTQRHRDFFWWQNRAIVSFGLRIMPLQRLSSPWLSKTKIYVEYARVVAYLLSAPTRWTPEGDWRIGVSIANNRY